MDEDDEILALFIEEAAEHLEGIENDLLSIEKDGENINSELVNKVFRAMHTIKGGSSFFGLNKIKDITHVAEGILDKVRNGLLIPNPKMIQCILQAIDLLSEMINNPPSMDGIDISDCLRNLESFMNDDDDYDDDIEPEPVNDELFISIRDKDGNKVFNIEQSVIEESAHTDKGGEFYYLIEFSKEDSTEQKLIDELSENLDDYCQTVTTPVILQERIYFFVCTVFEIDMLAGCAEIEEDNILVVDLDKIKEDNLTEGKVETGVLSKGELAEATALISGLIEEQKELTEDVKNVDLQDKSILKVSELDQNMVKAKNQVLLENQRVNNMAKLEESTKNQSLTKTKTQRVGGENIRVNIKLLEQLMSLAGELVLARNQLLQGSQHEDLDTMHQSAQAIDLVTSQLQETIMKTRMQEIGIVFNKFNRVVRDISGSLNKEVELRIEGDSVELDKTILEKIGDPLTHIVRNSLDHGLETPERRRAAGKSPVGNLSIKAYHEAGKVIIEIVDDGAGIDPEIVGSKAVEKGVVTKLELERMSEKEICNLIFKPGFSTAEEVTEISGRGVGMDVVLTNLTEINGIIDLVSVKGKGTTIKVSIPLTLAIMPSLLVSINNQSFAMPQVNLLQILRFSVNEISQKLQHIGDSLVTRFMDELIPVVRGTDILQEDAEPLNLDCANFGFKEPVQILVVASGDSKFGITIDMTLDSPEIVVKPFGRHLRSVPVYSGATILGDGSIAPILNIPGIMETMKVSQAVKDEYSAEELEDHGKEELQQLLIVSNGNTENYAIPLNQIVRIENIKEQQVKSVGSIRNIEFMGKSTALFTIDDAADVASLDFTGNSTAILFNMLGKNLALGVKEIVDSVELYVEFDESTYKQPGLLGSTYINGELTLLVDLFGIVAAKMPQWIEKREIHIHEKDRESTSKILVVDDSKFFLNQINSFLVEAGYRTVTAMDGKEALKVLREDDDIGLVLSDIEMPVMDGWELVTEIRRDSTLKHLPVIAVTSVTGDKNIKKALEVGMDEYLLKLDREELLNSVKKYNQMVMV